VTKEEAPISDEKLKQEPLNLLLIEINRNRENQRSLIVVSHGVIELFVNTLIEAHCKSAKRISEDTRGYPHSVRLLILHELGVLSDSKYKMYNWFRRLRNRAAHDPLFSVCKSDLSHLPEKFREPDKLWDLCMELVCSLWNRNKDVLLPRFVPSLAAQQKEGDER